MGVLVQYTLDIVLNIVKLGGRFATLVEEAITLRLLVGKAKLQLEGIQLSSLPLKILKPKVFAASQLISASPSSGKTPTKASNPRLISPIRSPPTVTVAWLTL